MSNFINVSLRVLNTLKFLKRNRRPYYGRLYCAVSPETNNEYKINQARDVLNSLSLDEKREIILELQLEEASIRKRIAEEKLASWHWRSKFGRPSSVNVKPINEDPSGTYCEIPQDWLKMKLAENAKPKPPTFSELRQTENAKRKPPTFSEYRQTAVFNALPFVGFGFLDNLIMIVAGDYIDASIGIYLGISTMAAAALGNTISDLAGIGSAWYVESIASKIGVRPPNLNAEQLKMASTRWCANIARGVGVCIGCIIGMFPLLFLRKKQKNLVEDTNGNTKIS